MTKCKSIVMAMVTVAFLCGIASAADFETRGSAVALGLYTSSKTSDGSDYRIPIYLVTNISGSAVTCRIKAYDHDGNDISSIIDVFTGNNTSAAAVSVSTGAASFSLPAGATRFVRVWDSGMNKITYGHAVIEWSSEDSKVKKPLMAFGHWYREGTGIASGSITVNGGQPF